jgi:AcrR family transcriptional regulator
MLTLLTYLDDVYTVNNNGPTMRATDKKRDLILDAAEAIARTSGLGAISMRSIAVKTGMTAPAAYRHFQNKEALLEALILRGYRGFLEGLEAARKGVDDPAERLRIAFRFYLSFWDRDRKAFLFMAERGSVKNGLSGAAIAQGSFGDVATDVAALLGPKAPSHATAYISRWAAAGLYGIAQSFSADEEAERTDRAEAIASAADFLVRAIIASSEDLNAKSS